MSFELKSSGSFKNITRFLETMRKRRIYEVLETYGEEGVRALRNATPRDSGETAESWSYEIEDLENAYYIHWRNSHRSGGTPVVIFIQYGHGTRNGGYVQGVDFINPALKELFDEMADKLWKEVQNA